ncbi:serine acetyltransferase [Enterococcus faecium]|nr:serine acetyltransferase [Enterococcus faecium]
MDTIIIRGLLNSQIPHRLKIGIGIKIWHPFGIIIHPDCLIGDNLTIRHQVTIGKAKDDGGVPVLGNNISIGTGAKILGDINIGDNTVIGANAVVTKSFPEKSILVGCPAVDISSKLKI